MNQPTHSGAVPSFFLMNQPPMVEQTSCRQQANPTVQCHHYYTVENAAPNLTWRRLTRKSCSSHLLQYSTNKNEKRIRSNCNQLYLDNASFIASSIIVPICRDQLELAGNCGTLRLATLSLNRATHICSIESNQILHFSLLFDRAEHPLLQYSTESFSLLCWIRSSSFVLALAVSKSEPVYR